MLKRLLPAGFLALLVFVQAAMAGPIPRDYYGKANPLFDLKGVDTPPEPIEQHPPKIPAELDKLTTKNTVVVEFIISKTGIVEFLRAAESSDPRFNDCTLAAVATWKFKPAIKKGSPVNCRVSQRIDFN